MKNFIVSTRRKKSMNRIKERERIKNKKYLNKTTKVRATRSSQRTKFFVVKLESTAGIGQSGTYKSSVGFTLKIVGIADRGRGGGSTECCRASEGSGRNEKDGYEDQERGGFTRRVCGVCGSRTRSSKIERKFGYLHATKFNDNACTNLIRKKKDVKQQW